ncbi:UNVERIFIED_CONTAM: hypothetical protein Slati_0917700 [Sesamum latifolium]|uniref:Uncharacterized protein n=1 Tax=Sesamum latifolium TaxID=2727402 RepID=A0AAW2XP10_9LAMI
MELGVGSHPGPGIYAYYLRPCCAELLDIGTSYPIRATTVATASPSRMGTHRPRYTLRLHRIRLMMTTSRIQSSLALTQDTTIVCT